MTVLTWSYIAFADYGIIIESEISGEEGENVTDQSQSTHKMLISMCMWDINYENAESQ